MKNIDNGGEEILSNIRKICQPILKWNDEKWQKESEIYLNLWNRCYGILKF